MLQPVVHVPHDSPEIPAEYRDQFVLSDAELAQEIVAMTDAHTHAMFAPLSSEERVLRFPVSRLLVDPERFEDDAQEPMSQRGMGVIYTHTSERAPLRRALAPHERQELLERFYRPHHARFTALVEEVLLAEGEVLIIDAHSFPSFPRPYELDQSPDRPEICIGVDTFHTPSVLQKACEKAFREAGFDVAIDRPFAGSIVPMKFYRENWHVRTIMIEVRRDLYMNERTGERLAEFGTIAERIRACCTAAIGNFARQ